MASDEASSSEAGADEVGTAGERWPSSAPSPRFPVVGLGGGAGAKDALVELLSGLQAGLGMALVFVPNPVDAGGGSRLVAELGPHTSMPIVEVLAPMRIEPDHVYLLAPGSRFEVKDWSLRPVANGPGEAVQAAQHPPIDGFFGALARDVESCAIGVMLSGVGSDGALGLREIKGVGGITISQEPASAAHDAMPRAAIASGAVDLVLPPARIAEELQRLGKHPYVRQPARTSSEELVVHPEQMARIFTMLRSASGVDFTHYKSPTIRRRLQRRMVLHRLDSVEQYIRYMRENPDEVSRLYQDLLIHVTRFFRDPESFKALAIEVFPSLIQQRRGSQPIRIWLPGCSTGEEAYSVAIAFLEFLGDDLSAITVQIFATDVSETAIDQARNGLYPESIAADLSPERLRQFFVRTDGSYRISKVVRDLCVFARQDVTRDPPFSKLDLIVCRNVLIYMGPVLQRKLMTVFHYALKASGFLMLGGAETVGAQAELFGVVDKKARIYGKKLTDSPASLQIPVDYHPGRVPSPGPRPAELHAAGGFQAEANRQILDRYGPPGVIIDEEFQITQFRGKTGAFLEPAPGEAALSLNLLKMARDGLLHGLRTALYSARKSDKPIRKEGLRVHSHGQVREVDLQIVPLQLPGESRHYLVLFEEATTRPEDSDAGANINTSPTDDEHMRQLQDELAASREYLQSIIQDLEAANEELQSANEEILSSNEELQSTNEELDTAKEELQSTNEELNTVNEELHGRNDELSRVNSDLVNLLGCVEIAIVIVGADLSIRRFTPMAEKVLNLIPTDIGRPISQIKPNIECPGLERLIARVIDTVTIQDLNVRDGEGNWYSLRIRPYKNVENRIDGAVLALFDIASRRNGLELRQARDINRTLLETLTQPVLLLDGHLRIQAANRAFIGRFQQSHEALLHRGLFEAAAGAWDNPGVRTLLQELLPNRGHVEDFKFEHVLPGLGRRHLSVNASFVEGFEPSASLVVLTLADCTPTGADAAV
ncbi:MAG: PAS domain-containing protein [Nannocystis sp.]|nr:CheR family methyltransferase [Nannocystis sp.]MBA3548646.1 PAS domain-containing protein [Nannocystis sp.]